LLEKRIDQGRVLLFTSGFDNLTNDLPLHPIFVAFIDRTARMLSNSDRSAGARLVDSYVQLQPMAGLGGESAAVEVVDPTGRRPLSLNQARTAQSIRLERAGFYRIRFADGRDTVIGVNPNRLESDLQPMPDDLRELWTGGSTQIPSPDRNTSAVNHSVRTTNLWWYVLVLAFLVALMETAIASRYMGTQREEA
jgi:hypothetical protein